MSGTSHDGHPFPPWQRLLGVALMLGMTQGVVLIICTIGNLLRDTLIPHLQ